MTTVSGRFRVYRVFPAVPHLNLLDVETSRLYTVYRDGYADRQSAVDALRTGDLITATLSGDPDEPGEAWRVESLERRGGVAHAVATDVDLPDVARECWAARADDATGPAGVAVTGEDAKAPVGECWVQPRDPLPDGAWARSVLTGLVPMEHLFDGLPQTGVVPSEVLVLDPDPVDAASYRLPYGVAVFLGESGRALGDDLRERYGRSLDRRDDDRPAFDPYAG